MQKTQPRTQVQLFYTVFGDPNGGYAALDQLIKEDGFISPAYQGIPTEKMAEVSPTLKKTHH